MKKFLVYGSHAYNHWFGGQGNRKPNDLDIISQLTLKELMEDEESREIITSLRDKSASKIIDVKWQDGFKTIMETNNDDVFVDPNLLYTIKVSHAAWNIKFRKTISHIILLKRHGCVLDRKILDELRVHWQTIHSMKKVKLTGTNEEFFKNTVRREYPHEFLHEHFKFHDKPYHERIRVDSGRPMCSEFLFNCLDEKEKLQCAFEEIMVIAVERFSLYDENHGERTPDMMIFMALDKLILTMTFGFFNIYLIENYDRLRKYDFGHQHFISKLGELKNEGGNNN